MNLTIRFLSWEAITVLRPRIPISTPWIFFANGVSKPLYYTNVFRHFLDADSSVMVSGNSMAHYYFKNSDGWKRHTFCEEITDIVDELSSRPEVDVVCARTGGAGGEVKIINPRGEALVNIDDEGLICYRSVSGDPLGYGFQSKKMDSSESLRLTIDSDYPDALLQILQLFESPRTGDVVVSSKPGYDLRATHENPEHHGSHGSLHKDHMAVPLLIRPTDAVRLCADSRYIL